MGPREELFRSELARGSDNFKPRDFMRLVKDAAFASLQLEPPRFRVNGSLLQMYYFEWPQNYEVSLGVHEHTNRVRIQLGFCGESEENLRRLGVVIDAAPEIMARLDVNLDMSERRYSDGQIRAFAGLTVPRKPLDRAFASELGGMLARFIEAMEPVVAPLGPLPWSARQARNLAR